MIQRAQTIFLFFASIAMILLFFFPLGGFYSEFGVYYFEIFRMKSLTPDVESPLSFLVMLPLIIGVIAIIVLNMVTIFSYKKRKRQMNYLHLSAFLHLLLITAVMFWYVPKMESIAQVQITYKGFYGVYLPLFSFLCTLMAQRYIRKDENFIRSMDRLR